MNIQVSSVLWGSVLLLVGTIAAALITGLFSKSNKSAELEADEKKEILDRLRAEVEDLRKERDAARLDAIQCREAGGKARAGEDHWRGLYYANMQQAIEAAKVRISGDVIGNPAQITQQIIALEAYKQTAQEPLPFHYDTTGEEFK